VCLRVAGGVRGVRDEAGSAQAIAARAQRGQRK